MESSGSWLIVFDVWLVARLRAEFPDADWTFRVVEQDHLVEAGPRSASKMPVVVRLPEYYRSRPPYVVAAQVASQIRQLAEKAGFAAVRPADQPPPGTQPAADAADSSLLEPQDQPLLPPEGPATDETVN